MQVSVVGDQFLDLGVSLVNIFGIARQRDPTERADTTAEQWTDISRNKAREIEGVFYANFFGHLTDVVAIVESWNASFLECQHGFNVFAHRSLGGFDHCSRIGHGAVAVLFPGPTFWQVAVEWIMGAGLVGDHVRAHTPANHFWQQFSGVPA